MTRENAKIAEPPTYITATRLKQEQGWTEELVGQHLGPADETRPNPHRPQGHPRRLFAESRVNQARERHP